jgi:hypothetical protein
MDILGRALTLLSWAGVAVLLLLLYRIAYFYQVTSKQPTHYRLVIIPIALLSLGGLCYAIGGDWGGVAGNGFEPVSNTVRSVGDGLQLAGGIALIGLGMFILQLMTGGRR